jgi:hypothetical protein
MGTSAWANFFRFQGEVSECELAMEDCKRPISFHPSLGSTFRCGHALIGQSGVGTGGERWSGDGEKWNHGAAAVSQWKRDAAALSEHVGGGRGDKTQSEFRNSQFKLYGNLR